MRRTLVNQRIHKRGKKHFHLLGIMVSVVLMLLIGCEKTSGREREETTTREVGRVIQQVLYDDDDQLQFEHYPSADEYKKDKYKKLCESLKKNGLKITKPPSKFEKFLYETTIGNILLVIFAIWVGYCVLSAIVVVFKKIIAIFKKSDPLYQLKQTRPSPYFALIVGAIILVGYVFNATKAEIYTGEATVKGFTIIGATLLVYFALRGLGQRNAKIEKTEKDEDGIEKDKKKNV